jgi:hypothetical protein
MTDPETQIDCPHLTGTATCTICQALHELRKQEELFKDSAGRGILKIIRQKMETFRNLLDEMESELPEEPKEKGSAK